MSEEDERMDVDEEEEDEDQDGAGFGPAALGLHRVGSKMPAKRTRTQPMQTLNARGMPARMRKKKNFYDDKEDVKPKISPLKRSPQKSLRRNARNSHYRNNNTADDVDEEEEDDDDDEEFRPNASQMRVVKREKPEAATANSSNIVNFDMMSEETDPLTTELLGRRLKNLLKLPKAHKFVMFEWFYSNLDQVLFKGENDFQVCLRETFPQLAARQLSRVEWSLIRRMMGKPRRCSQVNYISLYLQLLFFSNCQN